MRPIAYTKALVSEGKKESSLDGNRWDASHFSVQWVIRASQSQREERGPKV